MTHRLYLNDDWLFTEQFEDSLVAPEYQENTLQPVRLPHTCKETPFHYFDESLYQMVSQLVLAGIYFFCLYHFFRKN